MDSIYCPYSGKNIPSKAASPEHIFPLSLGGRNDFVVKVAREMNDLANREIDEPLSHCFYVAVDRKKHNARGHRNTKIHAPKIYGSLKRSNIPLRLIFDSNNLLQLQNPKNNQIVTANQILSEGMRFSFHFKKFLRLRFNAKVGLATAYTLFGNEIRSSLLAHELTTIMHLHGKLHNEVALSNLASQIWFWPHPSLNNGELTHMVFEALAKHINHSFVAFITSVQPNKVLIVIGILGSLAGVIFAPFDRIFASRNDDFDLGQVIILLKDTTKRISFRELLKEFQSSCKE